MATVRDDRLDDFEERRRHRETKNELIINHLRGILIAGGVLAHGSNYLFEWMPFRSPLLVVVVLSISLVVSIGLYIYLKRGPVYHPSRPYYISLFELFAVIVTAAGLAHNVDPALRPLMPLPLLALLIVLNGLRYSTRVVTMAGLVLASQWLIFAPMVPSAYRSLSISFAPMIIVLITCAVAYNVNSLIELHRESIWKERFRRFIAPELVDEMARNPAVLQQKTEHRMASVLFTDIRGFTTLSERLTPDDVVRFLNSFLDEMSTAIMNHHGMVDKYIGDCVMGIFGVPVAGEDHADRAVLAGLEMKERLAVLNQRLREQNLPELGIGVGIHSGDLVVGAIGSRNRLEYTVIGDTVNVASRIESLTRKYDTDILISDATRDALHDSRNMVEVGEVQVKGRHTPVKLWALS